MKKNSDLRPFRPFRGPFSLLQTLALVAILGLVLTGLYYWLS